MTEKSADDDERDESGLPRGLLEGLGRLDAPLDTPDVIRDCVRETYVDCPSRADFYKAATRIADDLKRRSFTKEMALEMVISVLTRRLGLTRDHLRQVEKAVNWTFEEQAHGLTCTGSLVREGLCFKADRRCRFHELAEELRAERVAAAPNGLPAVWEEHFMGTHPTDTLFARWVYGELLRHELRLLCVPGDPRTPILVGYRALADSIRAAQRCQAVDKNVVVRIMNLLQNVGLVRKVIQGASGARRRLANGYVRVLPIPQPPAPGGSVVPGENAGVHAAAATSPVPAVSSPRGPSVSTGQPSSPDSGQGPDADGIDSGYPGDQP